MSRKPRTWGEALDAAARRDAAEGTDSHGNAVVLAMIGQLGRQKASLQKALSPRQLVLLAKRPKKKAHPASAIPLLFICGGHR